jgi:hypothetical protein
MPTAIAHAAINTTVNTNTDTVSDSFPGRC